MDLSTNLTMDGKMQTTQPLHSDAGKSSSNKRIRSLVLKAVLITGAIAWLGLVAATWAEAKGRDSGSAQALENSKDKTESESASRAPASQVTNGAGNAGNEDDYNFNWLDPEKKIYVLQNRRYRKAKHALITGMIGAGFSSPYRTAYNFDPRMAYYFTESWGVEGFYTFTMNSANNIYDALVGSTGTSRPVIREIRSQGGGLVHWVPWYAKINVFNQILYFDWYFSAGVGSMSSRLESYDKTANRVTFADESLFAMYLGTGHQYHLSDRFIVRLDYMAGIYKAAIGDVAGTKAWFTNHDFAVGLGVKL